MPFEETEYCSTEGGELSFWDFPLNLAAAVRKRLQVACGWSASVGVTWSTFSFRCHKNFESTRCRIQDSASGFGGGGDRCSHSFPLCTSWLADALAGAERCLGIARLKNMLPTLWLRAHRDFGCG